MASTNMTNVNIRTDKDVKQAAEKIFEKLGLNMTTAINIFLRQSIRENGIPFNLKLNICRECFNDRFFNIYKLVVLSSLSVSKSKPNQKVIYKHSKILRENLL